MAKIVAVRKDALSEAPATPGLTRWLAFQGVDYVMVRSRAEPGAVTAWHHHGDHDVYGFILAGSERFEFGPGGEQAVTVHAGDFFHISPHVVHRDVNPSADEAQQAVLFFKSNAAQGGSPVVVNVDGPDPA